ncbi:MAG: putative b-glycosidase, glycoside hydrolase family 8 protein [Pseudomonadota bacterium]|jgi:hypothetical protein
MKLFTTYAKHLPMAAFFVLLTACGSGGGKKSNASVPGSSSSSSGSTKPAPVTNKINIKIDGLVGKIELVNGSDALVVSANGATQFAKSVEVGVSYNVQVLKQPENQICSVKNGRKVMVDNNPPVEISCSNGFGVAIDVVKPKDFGLKNLQVVSNYQRIGGANDPVLTLDSKIKTSQNSFIALKNASDEKTYFISYVYDAEQQRIKLDADHTALALLVMDPVITDAMSAHKLNVAGLFNLIAPMSAQNNRQIDGDLKKLSDEIAAQADKNVDLFGSQSKISALLEKANISVIDKISTLTAPATPPSNTDLGVEFKVENVAANKIALAVTNQRSRAVAVSLAGLNQPAVIDGYGTTKIEQNVEAGKFISLNVDVAGPGKLGNLIAANAGFKAAFIRSSLVDYYLPSLVYFSGSKNLSPELPLDCLSDENWQDLNAAGSNAWLSIQSLLEQDSYYKPYHGLADKYRAYWADAANMDDLLSCSSLGLSGLSAAEKLVAKSHLINLFVGFNKLREPNSVKEDLFRTEKQSTLASAIFNSAAQGVWAYSNAFTLDIKAPAIVDNETEVEFSARCLDAAKKEIACTLNWTLEDTKILEDTKATASSVKHLFKKPTNQIVNLVATGPGGAQISQEISISVASKSASIWVAKKDSSVAFDTTKPLEFDRVFVNTKLPQSLVIKNKGNKPLVISSIVISDAVFTTNLKETSIAVGAELTFDVEFKPLLANNYSGTITIISNDKLTASYQMTLTGIGVPAVTVGKYEVIENDAAPREEVVAATNETAISGDENFSQIRLFGQTSGVFPQISLKLLHFTGPGTYSLDDVDTDRDGFADETCLALYSAAKDYTQQYCTTSSSATRTGNSLVVTEIAADMYQVDYEFSAVNCLLPTGGASCTQKVIQLRGSTRVSKAVLEPLAP